MKTKTSKLTTDEIYVRIMRLAQTLRAADATRLEPSMRLDASQELIELAEQAAELEDLADATIRKQQQNLETTMVWHTSDDPNWAMVSNGITTARYEREQDQHGKYNITRFIKSDSVHIGTFNRADVAAYEAMRDANKIGLLGTPARYIETV